MNPLAAIRNLQNLIPTQTNSNPGQGASALGVENNYFNFFTVDQTYNGESFSAGDILIGNNTASNDNFVYKNGVFRIRYGTDNIITLHNLGMRLVDGGISLAPVASSTTFNGAHELTQNGAEMTTSRFRLTTATGAFTLNSIVAPMNQNLMLILSNETVQNMTLTNDYATPTSGYWAIHTYTGADVTTSGNGMAFLVGNAAQSRWDLISAVSVGVVASSSGNYVTIGNDAALSSERALTGTANQITVTDNGANSTVVLSTPQNIHTAATPTFQSLTLSHTAPTIDMTDSTGGAKSLRVTTDANKTTLKEASGGNIVTLDLAASSFILNDYGIMRVIQKTGIADNVATGIFTITTTNETGNVDGGAFVCDVVAIVTHIATSGAANNAVVKYRGSFSREIISTGTGTNTAVEDTFTGTSAASTSATRDIASVTMSVTETSEYVQTVNFTVDLNGADVQTAEVTCFIRILYTGFLTAPVIAAA